MLKIMHVIESKPIHLKGYKIMDLNNRNIVENSLIIKVKSFPPLESAIK